MLELITASFETVATPAGYGFVLNILCALVLGGLVCMGYRMSFSARAFSKRYMTTLLVIGAVTSGAVSVVGDSVALAVLFLAAVTLIRFKTNVKDSRLAAFMAWAVVIGICSGLGLYLEAVIIAVVVFAVVAVIGRVRNFGTYLLVVKTKPGVQRETEESVESYYRNAAKLKVKNASRESSELIYEIGKSAYSKSASSRGNSITDVLLQVEGVISVDVVSGNVDIAD